MKAAKNRTTAKEVSFTIEELEAIYKIARENLEQAPISDDEIYNDYYNEYETPINKKVFRSILKKISRHVPTKEVEKEFLRRKYHPYKNNIDGKAYAIMRKAKDQLKTIEISYFTMETADFTKRKIDIYYTSTKYTIGYCHLRKAIRKFRTSRIGSAKITNETYTIPEDFNKNDY